MPVETRANKRQQQAAATREQLVQAARESFEELGYQQTTVGSITDRANTAHGTFYLYFKNKEDAFCCVMEEVIDVLYVEAHSPWGTTPKHGIEQGLLGFLRRFAQHRGLWRALLEGMLQSKKIEEVWLGLRRTFIDRLALVLTAQQEAGGVRDFDPVMTAHAVGSMTEWFAFTHLVLDEPATSSDPVDDLAAVLADLWYHAIYGVTPST